MQAKKDLHKGIGYLLEQEVDAIILGCTEISFALTDKEIKGIPLIDVTKVLARVLIINIHLMLYLNRVAIKLSRLKHPQSRSATLPQPKRLNVATPESGAKKITPKFVLTVQKKLHWFQL